MISENITDLVCHAGLCRTTWDRHSTGIFFSTGQESSLVMF